MYIFCVPPPGLTRLSSGDLPSAVPVSVGFGEKQTYQTMPKMARAIIKIDSDTTTIICFLLQPIQYLLLLFSCLGGSLGGSLGGCSKF